MHGLTDSWVRFPASFLDSPSDNPLILTCMKTIDPQISKSIYPSAAQVNAINPSIQKSINPAVSVVRLFASSKSWIKGEALRQFHATAKLEGVRLAVGFPDLHPGKGGAVGEIGRASC